MTWVSVRRLLGAPSSAALIIALHTHAVAGVPNTPITSPHGENGKISHSNGEDYISYEYVEAPGAQHTPAVFKVFRPRADPPAGLAKPRIAAGDVGSWAFIGEGSLRPMSAMMDLDANGIVTWVFMTPDKLEQYRPAASASVPAQTNASSPSSAPFSDANFPKKEERLELAPNDFDALSLAYSYYNGWDLPSVTVYFKRISARMKYLGFNEAGAWLTDNPLDPNRLYTFKNGVSVPIPNSIACNGGIGICTATGMLTRLQESAVVPNNLRNRPAPVAVSNGGPPDWKARDPNFPMYDASYVLLAANDFGARQMNYNYANGKDQPFLVVIEIAGRNAQFTYLGFNEEGAWLTAVDIDPKRLFVLKGGVRVAIPDSPDCQHGSGECWAGGELTRKPYSTPLPKNLRNSGEGTLAYFSGKFGDGPTAEQEAAQNERMQKLFAVDEQLSGLHQQVMQELWGSNYADPNQKVLDRERADKTFSAWRVRIQKDCGLTTVGSPTPLRNWGNSGVKTDAAYDCMMERMREHIALYQKFRTEFAARNVSTESWAAIGVSDTQPDGTAATPVASSTAEPKDPAQQLGDLDLEARAMQGRVANAMQQKLGRGGGSRVASAHEAWTYQRQRSCTRGGNPIAANSTNPVFIKCLIALTRARIALYQKALDELAAGNLSDQTRAAVDAK